MGKIYFKIIVLLLGVLALIGYVLPYLFSAKDSMLVGAGVILLALAIPATFIFVKKIYSDAKWRISAGNTLRNAVVVIMAFAALSGCSKVPAGNVGVKVYLLGGEKGVDSEVLRVGRYWIGINEDLFLFPTFTQNYVWTKDATEGSPTDESITFQTQEGLGVNADIGISYHIDTDKVSLIFQKYRKGVDEITDIYLRNMVRDAFTW